MRIDLFDSTASEMAGEMNANPPTPGSLRRFPPGAGGDRTTLTSGSAAVSSLVSEAMNSPAIRQDMVQSLKQEIASGQYKLDPDKIAGAMIDEHA